MEKRWITFFLVFTVAWFTLLAPMLKPSEPAQDESATAETAPASSANAETPGVRPAEPHSESADSSETETSSSSSKPVRLESFRVQDHPIETVETGLATIQIAHLGASPISWVIHPTESLAATRDVDTGTTQVINLIPQVEDTGDREFPFFLEGRGVESFNRELFTLERSTDDQGAHVLRFSSPVKDQMRVVKTYRFQPDSYLADVTVEVLNGGMRSRLGESSVGWGIGWQGGFMQPEAQTRRFTGRIQAVASVDGDLKLKGLKMGDRPVEFESNVAWAGQEKKFFAALLVPNPANPAERVEFSVRRRNMTPAYEDKAIADPMSVVLYHESRELQPDEIASLRYTVLAAPKEYDHLKALSAQTPMIDDGLPLARVTFGQMPLGQNWVRPICILLLHMLRLFESFIHNWGMAIIVLVLIVKIVLYPLSHWAIKAQAKTMAEQKRIKPHVERLNEKYKDDPAKKSQELMKLYREHGINPLGAMRGCLPMVFQMPIFFALYILLDQAVEVRGQSFLWIVDLSSPDRLIPFGGYEIPLLGWDALNILPILMAVTQFFTSRLMTSNISDPTQKQIMIMMPIFFVFILYNMPAGLMLYWTVQNVWQIGHTVLTKRYVAMHDEEASGSAGATARA